MRFRGILTPVAALSGQLPYPDRRLLAFLVIALIGAACSRSVPLHSPPTGSTGQPRPFDPNATITYALDQEPTNFNVLTAGGNGFDGEQIMDRLWPSVFHTDPSAAFVLDPVLMLGATETSTSPQTVVYQLNPQARWSDGVPINADDFVYNWQAQSGLAQYSDVGGKPFDVASNTGYSQIAEVSASADKFTVTTTYSAPFADWPSLFQNLAPAHVMKVIGWNTGLVAARVDARTMISGGPFGFGSYSPGKDLMVKRNPNYWGPPAHLASVDYRFIPDSSASELALANNEVQASYPQPQLDLIAQLNKLRPKVKLDERPGLVFEHLDFNQANPFLGDLFLRKAIALAIDRPTLIKDTVGQFAQGIVPDNSHLFVPSQGQYRDNSAGSATATVGPGPYDHAHLAAARSLLAANGYALANRSCCPGSPSTLMKGSQAVTLRITSTQGNALRANEEQFVVAALAQLGIRVTEADTTDLNGTLANGTFDLVIFSWVESPVPSGNDPIYQSPTRSTGANNFDHFSLPEVDGLIAQADVAPTPAAEAALYNRVDAALWANMVTLPLFQQPTLLVYYAQYQNLRNNITSEGPVYNEEQWGVARTR